jgi:glycosyltransferase 2 family protein
VKSRRLLVNLLLSVGMLAICVWLVWPDAKGRHQLGEVLSSIEVRTFWPTLAGYLALLAATHFFRAWRWNNLLRPIGVDLAPGRLLTISSVGFMAILALPARLGEFVRPALVRKRGEVSASAVLGTVAVERIVDGLVVSVLVFVCSFAKRGPDAPDWMMPVAYTSLGIFVAAMVFLAFALRNPKRTCRIAVSMTGVRWIAPRLAGKIEEKLEQMISGFLVLRDRRNLAIFVVWSAMYWLCNGLSMWILARGMRLELPVVGAFATMGIVAVGITLPNSPGLVGQYHWFTMLGLSLYLAPEVAKGSAGLAYAILLHGIQVVWYVGIGALCMMSSHISFAEVIAPATSASPSPSP